MALSPEERLEHDRASRKRWRENHPEYLEKRRERYATDENFKAEQKARSLAWKNAEYERNPEFRAACLAAQRAYSATPQGKKTRATYRSKPEVKKAHNAHCKKSHQKSKESKLNATLNQMGGSVGDVQQLKMRLLEMMEQSPGMKFFAFREPTTGRICGIARQDLLDAYVIAHAGSVV